MTTISLDGAWRFRKAGDRAWMPAKVPGSNFTDLLALGKIPDPFKLDNELKVTWVFNAGWEYEREVGVPARLLAHDTVWLECGGLDTIATVRVNGRVAGRTDNMFMPHRFEVKRLLRPGRNTVRVVFATPVVNKPRNAAEKLAGGDPHSVPGGAVVRKAGCHYGWDWGPSSRRRVYGRRSRSGAATRPGFPMSISGSPTAGLPAYGGVEATPGVSADAETPRITPTAA